MELIFGNWSRYAVEVSIQISAETPNRMRIREEYQRKQKLPWEKISYIVHKGVVFKSGRCVLMGLTERWIAHKRTSTERASHLRLCQIAERTPLPIIWGFWRKIMVENVFSVIRLALWQRTKLRSFTIYCENVLFQKVKSKKNQPLPKDEWL